jgi:DNA gyrase/topoisomerase IV subunit B
MWIGAIDPITQDIFIVNEDKVEQKTISFVPAFKKICDEILDNSIDALIEHSNAEGSIKVKMSDDCIYIEDDGPGIPVQKKKLSDAEVKNLPQQEAKELQGSYIPEIAWTRLFSGTNFQDSSGKVTIGSHGVGSKAAAIFSTKFIGKTDDGKKSCTVTVLNNLESHKCKVGETSHKTGTSVEFWPDLKRFSLFKIDAVYYDLMYQRLLCLAMTFPKIKFSFNGKRINANDKKFLKMFSESIEFMTFSNGFIGVYPNESDEFNFFTYVNGMHMSRGGSHVEYIANQLVGPIRAKLEKKYKTIKPADIKNKFTLVVFMRNFANPKFDSQTKETLTNSPSDIASYFNNEVDFDAFAKKVLKNDAIIEPIVETFKIKEELKARQELKRAKKVKVRSDKYMAPIGEHKYLALCEGASAMSGISSCLGRNGFGWYSMRGVPLNSYSSSMQKIVANAELKDILNILELDISKSEEKKTIDFEKVLITSDNDADGQHITAMLIGWFKRFAPNLFDEGRICKLITPLITLKDKNGKIAKYFFNVPDFKAWEAKNSTSSYKLQYAKGLGSWERADLIGLFDSVGLENFILEYKLDAEGSVYIEDWLGNDPEKRKQYLREYTFDINQA